MQLGTATPFAVLAATAVTDIPTSSITGDVGLSPAAGTNYAGLTQAEVTGHDLLDRRHRPRRSRQRPGAADHGQERSDDGLRGRRRSATDLDVRHR